MILLSKAVLNKSGLFFASSQVVHSESTEAKKREKSGQVSFFRSKQNRSLHLCRAQ